jgi:hypothetical protein
VRGARVKFRTLVMSFNECSAFNSPTHVLNVFKSTYSTNGTQMYYFVQGTALTTMFIFTTVYIFSL